MPKKTKKIDSFPTVEKDKLITIDFAKYPKLFDTINRIQEHSYFPLEHVLVNLISSGIIVSADMNVVNRAIINLQDKQEAAEEL